MQEQMIRVLAVVDDLEVGGAQQHILTLASGLRRHGYEVVVATSGRGKMTPAFGAAGITVRSLTSRSIRRSLHPAFTARLVRVAGEGFDLIHGHLHAASLAAAVASRASGLPLVLTRHSMNTWQGEEERARQGRVERQADAVIAVAANAAADIAGDARRVVIPNGVDLPRLSCPPHERATVRRLFDLPPQAYVVAHVARCVPDKDPLLFVEAAAAVAARNDRAHFFLVGDGPLRPSIEARARWLGLHRRCRFIGAYTPARDLLPAADVLVLTSRSECAPIAVLEAMAVGLPVVATSTGDVPVQIAGGESGFVVPIGDSAALAQRLCDLSPSSRTSAFGLCGRERAQRHFAADGMAARTATVYAEVLRRGRLLDGGRDRATAGRPGARP